MRFGKIVSVLAAGLLLVGAASAQQRQGGLGGFAGFGGGGAGLAGMLGQNKQLQDELKLEKDQVDKVTEAITKVREDLRDDTAKLRDRNTSDADRAEITKKVSDAYAKALGAVLTADQLKRLHQIENQQAGVNLFTKEDTQKALKLTDAQNESIKDITTDLQKDIRSLSTGGGRGGFDPETVQKRQALQKEAMDAVVKLLKDDQKATLKDLTGEPFELRLQGFGGAGGFGAGGAGRGGFAGFGGRTQPGQVLSSGTQDRLKLTDEQKKAVDELQKEVDGKLEKILTDDQNKQLKDLRDAAGRGTGGRGRTRNPNGNPPQ
jgi:Spy/CpxP family protein refolding chaperone